MLDFPAFIENTNISSTLQVFELI